MLQYGMMMIHVFIIQVEGKNGEIYYVLYSNFDVERAESKYIGCLSTQVLIATQQENALNCLGLQMKNGHISKKSNYHVGIVSAPTFMSQFISKLKNGELKIETCPQVEVGPELTEEYIIEQLESYQKLLESGIIDEATKEEQGPVKKLVPNNKKIITINFNNS